MSENKKSKIHHWWPVALQSYWSDSNNQVSWINPEGKVTSRNYDNRKIGKKFHGHTVFRGSDWETNFEIDFDIDNDIHEIINGLRNLSHERDNLIFQHLDKKLHRKVLLLIYSLIIRSPGSRFRYEGYSQIVGLDRDEDTGKANMVQNYRIAKDICKNNLISNQYFVILHSLSGNFYFGDGCLDWLTSSLLTKSIRGKALVPLTPHFCLYFCTPISMMSTPNCASLTVASWMEDCVNEIIQIYSKEQIFFRGKTPEIIDAFRQNKFLEYTVNSNKFIDMLDKIAGSIRRGGPNLFGSEIIS